MASCLGEAMQVLFIRACDYLSVREQVNNPFLIKWYDTYTYDVQPHLNLTRQVGLLHKPEMDHWEALHTTG